MSQLTWTQRPSCQHKRTKPISKDELVSVMDLNDRLDHFIMGFMVVPEVTISLAHPELMKEARALLSLSSEDSSLPQLISYDATFKIGDFYLSPLVMRNTKLKGNPVFPLAFFLHKEKFTSWHQDFLHKIVTKLGAEHMKDVPFLTDKEKGLDQIFPPIPNLYHWNCILNDVSTWIKKHRRTKNSAVLKDHMALLLKSASEEDYQHNYEQCSLLWSQPFKKYFDKELKDIIPNHAARFFIQKFSAFKNDVAATNDIYEIMNRFMKDESNWKEMSIDCLIQSMYCMQTVFLYEFQQAYCGLENYALKEHLHETGESQSHRASSPKKMRKKQDYKEN